MADRIEIVAGWLGIDFGEPSDVAPSFDRCDRCGAIVAKTEELHASAESNWLLCSECHPPELTKSTERTSK